MIRRRPLHPRGDGSGIVWPQIANATPGNVKDVFGPRPFLPHVGTVGYDYDLHRGIDVTANAGDPVYSMQCGAIIRWHYTHFGWEADSQLDQWSEVDPAGSVSFARQAPSTLLITGDRVGAQTFPATAGRFQPVRERVMPDTNDWELRLSFTNPISTTGQLGFGILDTLTNELAAIEYDGTTFTVRGVDSGGAMGVDGSTFAVANKPWVRVRFDFATTTIFWDWSDDQETWVNIASQAAVSFTNGIIPVFLPVLYWRSTDVNANPDTVEIDTFGWYDDQTIPRFGNWVEMSSAGRRFLIMHQRELLVPQGTILYTAGAQIGTVGNTGFDAKSGPVLYNHFHIERIDNNDYDYNNDDPQNALAIGILPRTNVLNNITAVRTSENDPDGNPSFRLAITVTRADQNFDLNQISLTGDVATRTINWDTRSGLNPNNDIPVWDGVYVVPVAFDGASASYQCSVYFNTATVGSTFVSAEIRDTNGNVVWSE